MSTRSSPSRNVLATKSEGTNDAAPVSSNRGSGIRRVVLPEPLPPPSEGLAAALSFLEGVASRRMCREELRSWIDRNLVHTGYMARPWRIQEPLFGALPADKHCSAFLPEIPPTDETAAILVRTRARVVGYLRGLLQSPVDDRFLSAAIFAGRVRRVVVGDSMQWVPRPRSHDILSDIVMSLFVSDILGQREFYAQNLCICDTCGRVRFDPEPPQRDKCFFC
ncbi:hypothetical protein [Polyangium jinanense]|uniref:Uncharacterized protein n=1 Tax=Polyangium jinanense TaxID=2829994 RepID=A0A9X3X8D4_9BACT|nr:hypothetical protein [Polyangium jinanense]MDC3955892.1 hypothetical protein [Polyangium jinanense]MDC3983251.1 hypothetical protein [Polyangium jinanense]MDC3985169.1 hypothetical protein [Polyangium jinanense]